MLLASSDETAAGQFGWSCAAASAQNASVTCSHLLRMPNCLPLETQCLHPPAVRPVLQSQSSAISSSCSYYWPSSFNPSPGTITHTFVSVSKLKSVLPLIVCFCWPRYCQTRTRGRCMTSLGRRASRGACPGVLGEWGVSLGASQEVGGHSSGPQIQRTSSAR